MNERINQLYAESVMSVHEAFIARMLVPSKVDLQFAELIVRECLEACSRANEIRHFVPPTQEQVVLSCMREIEQHFGVEE
jgi:hypothetical protein